jgi:hypothetical protein
MSFASWVTWLEGVIPRACDRMCGLPPAIVSANWRDRRNWPFQGSEYRSYPLPFDHRFSPLLRPIPGSQTAFSAASPKTLTGKPFLRLGLSWLSFSRPRDLPAVPERGQRPAPTVTSRRLPTPAHVQRTCRYRQARSPWADLRPYGRAPTSRHDGPDAHASGCFRIAPIPRAGAKTPAREQIAIGSNAEIDP